MPELPSRVTTPLLTLVTQQSLDEDYLHVAERRAAGGEPPKARRSHRTAAVVVAIFGLLVSVAAVQVSRNAGVASASRASLVSRIDDERARVAGLQERIVALREANVRLGERLDRINAQRRDLDDRTQAMSARAGFVPVSGPGVRITVDDAPDGTPVRDRDLRLLVDGLWNAGAEAIAIDGQRLSTRSAIRNSAQAIHVNVHPLSPPYVVLAIGDTRTLQANLLDSTSGLAFRGVAEALGFPVSMDNEDHLELPAAPSSQLELRSARVTGPAGASTADGADDSTAKPNDKETNR